MTEAEGRARMVIEIVPGDLGDPRVAALLAHHAAHARGQTAPGSAHVLDLERLRDPAILFRAAWDGETLLGVGALKRLGGGEGEIKSMHTAEAARGKGVGRAMLRHLVATARAEGMIRLSLETGAWDYFAPARALYRGHGFTDAAPFGDYGEDPNSVFLTMAL